MLSALAACSSYSPLGGRPRQISIRKINTRNCLPLGSRLHYEAENSVAGAANSQASDQLVAQRLGLGEVKTEQKVGMVYTRLWRCYIGPEQWRRVP
jgi:hypothetical protein